MGFLAGACLGLAGVAYSYLCSAGLSGMGAVLLADRVVIFLLSYDMPPNNNQLIISLSSNSLALESPQHQLPVVVLEGPLVHRHVGPVAHGRRAGGLLVGHRAPAGDLGRGPLLFDPL